MTLGSRGDCEENTCSERTWKLTVDFSLVFQLPLPSIIAQFRVLPS